MNGAPYETVVESDVVSGEDNFIAVRFPHRGWLTKLVIKQVTGPAAGFTADVYNSAQPAEAGSSASALETYDASSYRVLPTQTEATDELSVFANPGYAYINRDGDPTNPDRRLHVRINPSGTGTKRFEITLGAITVM